MDFPCFIKFGHYHEIPKILFAIGLSSYVIYEGIIFLMWEYAIMGFCAVECICSLKIISCIKEMISKSKAISTIRFSKTSSNLYDGGQSAQLNQEFALILKTQYGYVLLIKWIVSVLYIIGSILYDHEQDPLMP